MFSVKSLVELMWDGGWGGEGEGEAEGRGGGRGGLFCEFCTGKHIIICYKQET